MGSAYWAGLTAYFLCLREGDVLSSVTPEGTKCDDAVYRGSHFVLNGACFGAEDDRAGVSRSEGGGALEWGSLSGAV